MNCSIDFCIALSELAPVSSKNSSKYIHFNKIFKICVSPNEKVRRKMEYIRLNFLEIRAWFVHYFTAWLKKSIILPHFI